MAAISASACIGFTSLVPWLFNLTFFERRNRQIGKYRSRDVGGVAWQPSVVVGIGPRTSCTRLLLRFVEYLVIKET